MANKRSNGFHKVVQVLVKIDIPLPYNMVHPTAMSHESTIELEKKERIERAGKSLYVKLYKSIYKSISIKIDLVLHVFFQQLRIRVCVGTSVCILASSQAALALLRW